MLEQALASGTDRVARRDHAGDRPGARRARDAAVRLHPRATSITAARWRRSTCARSSRSARCAIPTAIAPLQRGAVPRRVVGAAAHRGAARRRGGGAGAHRHARGAVAVLEEAASQRAARRPDGGARAADAAPPARPRGAEADAVTAPRVQLADELLRRFAAALRCGAAVFAGPSARRAQPRGAVGGACSCSTACSRRSSSASSATRSIVGDMPMAKAETIGPLIRRLQQSGIERITIDRGVTTRRAHARSSTRVTTLEPRRRRRRGAGVPGACRTSASGGVTVEERVDGSLDRHGHDQRLYTDAVSVAEQRVGQRADRRASPTRPRRATMVDGLAQAVAQNRTALLALTALKNYDNYTFTHMVNVSILTMGQARGARHRRPAAARVRPGGADARHRQGADADRDPEQAGQADRRTSSRS